MKRETIKEVLCGVLVVLVLGISPMQEADACTRAVYLGPDGTIITARSMDWVENMGTDLWAFPPGMQRDGAAGPTSVKWVSKYGSVASSFYNIATVDGINEKGLVANMLYLVESDYGKPDGKRPTISIAAWTQHALDNYATVAEVVNAMRGDPFVVVAPTLPNGEPAAGHLAISDATGDSAVFEYISGKTYSGNAASKFEPAQPFAFLPGTVK
jgi:penicillin V acylase-like amidase (Ntn superfamily)